MVNDVELYQPSIYPIHKNYMPYLSMQVFFSFLGCVPLSWQRM